MRACFERGSRPNAQEEAAADHFFRAPLFIFQGELFWELPVLEERLKEARLAL
jgi:hypothetical protein